MIEKYFWNVAKAEDVVGGEGITYTGIHETAMQDIDIFVCAYEEEAIQNKYYTYANGASQQGMRDFVYYACYWYEEDKTIFDIVSESDMEMLDEYTSEYYNYVNLLDGLIATDVYLDRWAKSIQEGKYTHEDNTNYPGYLNTFISDFINSLEDSEEDIRKNIIENYIYNDLFEFEDGLRQARRLNPEERLRWYRENEELIIRVNGIINRLLEFMLENFNTLDKRIQDILSKYDELTNGQENSELMEKSLQVSTGKTTKKGRTSIMSFSGEHRSGSLFYEALNLDNMYCRWCNQKLRAENTVYPGYWTIWQGVEITPRYVRDHPEFIVPALCGETFGNITFLDARKGSQYIVGESVYTIVGNRNAMAMEAYILAHSGGKGSHPSAQQIAWWNTEILGNGNIINGTDITNSFTAEAETFQNFADKLTTRHATSSNGFNYQAPKWMGGKKTIDGYDYDFDRVTVDYDDSKNEYIVGPFAVNFVRSSYGDVDFGIIEYMTLVTDKYQDGIRWDSNSATCGWKIQLEDGSICTDLGQIKGKRPFYIIVEYNRGKIDKKILNVKVGIKYMNASGNYDQLEGEYDYRKYKMYGITGIDKYEWEENCHMTNSYLHIKKYTAQGESCGKTEEYEVEYNTTAGYRRLTKKGDPSIFDLYGPNSDGRCTIIIRESDSKFFHETTPGYSAPTVYEIKDDFRAYYKLDGTRVIFDPVNGQPRSTADIGRQRRNDIVVEAIPDDDGPVHSAYEFVASDVDDASIDNQYEYYELDPVGRGWDIGLADSSRYQIYPGLEECYIYGYTADADQYASEMYQHFNSFHYNTDILKPVIAIGYLGPGVETWQYLNAAIKASLWYEHYECSLISTVNDSKLTVIKDMDDANGKPIDASIRFNLSVDNEKTIIDYKDSQMVINPSKKTAVSSRVYYYQDKDGLDFTLKEIKSRGYEDYAIESVEAKDNEGNPVAVTLSGDKTTITGKMPQNGLTLHIKNKDTNQDKKDAKIQIKKKIENTGEGYPYSMGTASAEQTMINYHDGNEKTENKYNRFPFKVTISPGKESSFEYDGEYYVDSTILTSFINAHPEIDRGKIHEGEYVFYTSVASYVEGDEITENKKQDISVFWYSGTNPPEYNVEEQDDEAVKKTEAELADSTNRDKIMTKYGSTAGSKAIAMYMDANTMDLIKKSVKGTQKDGIVNERGVFTSSADRPYDENGNEKDGDNDEDYIEVIAKNTTGPDNPSDKYGNLKIIKTLDLSNFVATGMTNEDLEEHIDKTIEEYARNNGNKPLFEFNVTVGDKTEKAEIQGSGAQKIYKDGKLTAYRWEWISDDFKISTANKTPYTVTELADEDSLATSKNLFTKSGYMVIDGTAVVGLDEGQTLDDTFSSFLNRIEEEEVGLEIGKIIDNATKTKLTGKKLHFNVSLDGYFSYYDGDNLELRYGYHKVRLTTTDEGIDFLDLSKVEGSTGELNEDIEIDQKYLTVNPEELDANETNPINTILSNAKIKYFKSDAKDLKILISEETVNMDDTINSYAINGVTKDGWTSIEEINKPGNVISEVFKNEEIGPDVETAMLRINKKLRGISNLTDKEKDDLKFKFNVKIAKQNKETNEWEAVEDRTITLKYNDPYYGANEWNWIDDKITWDPKKYNTPVYMVQEDVSELPDYITFDGFNVGGTYKTVDIDDGEYSALFGKISGSAETIFASDTGVSIYEDYVRDLVKRVSLEDHAVIGVMTPKGKSEAVDEHDSTNALGIDESVDTVDIYATNSTEDTDVKEGKIKISKTIKSKLDEKKEFAVVVKINSGKFTLGGTEYDMSEHKDGLYLTKNNTLVDKNTYYGTAVPGLGAVPDLSQALVIRIDEESNYIESGVFKWKKGEQAPEYEILNEEYYREITNDTVNTQLKKYGTENDETYSISSKDGTIKNGDGNNLQGLINSEIVNIDFTNEIGPESKKVSIRLRKKYNRKEEKELIEELYEDEPEELARFENARKEELKKNTFEFDLNIIGVKKYEPVLTFDHIENEGSSEETYVYTSKGYVVEEERNKDLYTVEVPIISGVSEFEYEIKEKTSRGSGLAFKSFIVENVESNEPVYRGTLRVGDNETLVMVDTDTDITAENILNGGVEGNDEGKLQIYKEVISNDAGTTSISDTLNFMVKIDNAPDFANGKDENIYAIYTNGDQKVRLERGTSYYLSNDESGNEVLTTDASKRISIPFKGSLSEAWTMQGKLEWIDSYVAPLYTIKEDPVYTGYAVVYEGSEQSDSKTGSFNDTDPNGYAKTFIKNTSGGGGGGGDDTVFLRLVKKFEGSCDKQKEFKFKIDVQGHATQYVTLTTPKTSSNESEISKTFSYKIGQDQEYLDYKITEVELPSDAVFRYYTENLDSTRMISNWSREISGRLMKNSTNNTLEVKCVNSDGYGGKDFESSLSLKKAGIKADDSREFKFRIRIDAENAVEVIGGELGHQLSDTGIGYIDSNESKIFEVTVNPQKDVSLGRFKWAGSSEGGPSYTVEEISDESGNTIKGSAINSTKKMVKGESYQITQYNEETTYGGYIKVHKEYDSESKQKPINPDQEFTFDVYVYDKNPTDPNAKVLHKFKNNKVKIDETWTSELITWKGQDIPYYYVVEQEPDQEDGTWEATVGGEPVNNKEHAKQIAILYKSNSDINSEIEGIDETNKSAVLGYNYNNPDELKLEDKVIITNHKDDEDELEGGFKIIKEVEAEKLGVEDDMPEEGFEIEITVSGNFKLYGQSYTEWKNIIYLSNNESFEQQLTWDKNAAPPTVTIKENGLDEINKNTENGVWTLDGISNNGASLIEDDTVVMYVNNKFSRGFARRILYDIGGNVWEDRPNEEDKNSPESYDGIKQSSEEGISKVEVYVYRTSDDSLVDLYTETGAPVVQPVMTDAYGRWDASLKIKDAGDLTSNKFYVVFVYDGQTYEPTRLLAHGTAKEYIGATAANRVAWEKVSMAKDIKNIGEARGSIQQNYNRATANEKLHYIQGKLPIDGNGKTTGTAYSTQAGAKMYELNYTSDISTDSREGIGTFSTPRVKSTLKTTYDDGRVIEQYKVAASTKSAGLTYPFDKQMVLTSETHKKKDYNNGGSFVTYRAGYPYSLHINMGLRKRSEADLYAAKDLEKATVVVNGRKLTYEFKSLAQRINKPIEIDGYFDDMYTDEQYSTTCYRIGLYKTDYYYRAELYQNNSNYDELYDFYKKLMNYSNGLESTEMEAFLTYKISIYNASPTYDAHVYSINDYSEESLELVTSNVIRYIKNPNGTNNIEQIETASTGNNPRGEVIVDVNNPSGTSRDGLSLTAINASNNQVVKIENGDVVNGSDGYAYRKTSFTFDNSGSDYYTVASGEIKDYYLTYRVKKGNYDNVSRAIKLGTKSNIVEISRYSTFDKGTNTIAGKVDRNSAPDNVNIEEYNNESRYEDDTYITRARLSLITDDYNKKITGTAWEDRKEVEKNSSNGNGKYDEETEALIGGMATELVEKVLVPNGVAKGTATNDYTEYDFLWSTSEALQVYGGKSYESLTGFSSTTETSRVNADGLKVGEYKFEYIPAGDYVVRFKYGIDKSNVPTGNNIYISDGIVRKTGEPIALNKEGKAWATAKEKDSSKVGVYTANYYEKRYGQTPAIYNGQDYKSTIYQKGETDEDKAIDNELRDSESRRLEVMSNSEIITNSNGHDMYEANNTDGKHYMIHEFYNMYADSDKYSIYQYNDKSNNPQNTKVGTYTNYSGNRVQSTPAMEDSNYESNEEMSQVIANINIGLVERPENKIVLDKEISSIRLTSNDNKLLFNAVYDLDYVIKTEDEIEDDRNKNQKGPIIITKLADGSYLVAQSVLNADKSVGVDVMQQIDKVEKKLEYMGDINEGIQNFRYINMDDDVLQGLHVEIGYKIVALNVGETDYTHECIENLSGNEALADQMLEYAKAIRRENAKYKKNGSNLEPNGLEFGDRNTEYYDYTQKESLGGDIGIGNYYYTGEKGEHDVPVSSRARVVMDYVDNDAVFDTENNRKNDHYWKNVSVKELDGGGSLINRLIDSTISNGTYILDKDNRKYIVESHQNIATNLDTINDSVEPSDSEGTNNGGFEMRLLPFTFNDNLIVNNVLQTNVVVNEENSNPYKAASILELTVTKNTSAETDANSMSYDNLVEILKYENSVGRRDMTVVPGNANPKYGEFYISMDERDTSATELITFTPPTGTFYKDVINNQLMIAVTSGLSIIAIGIFIIKKKVIDVDVKNVSNSKKTKK